MIGIVSLCEGSEREKEVRNGEVWDAAGSIAGMGKHQQTSVSIIWT
jgi:hypothetical protein